MSALWHLDAALGAVLAGGREPAISQIKLAWWREALARLDSAPVPAEPVLQALTRYVLPRGVSGGELAAMEEGWATLLKEEPLGPDDLAAYASRRGAVMFRLSAQVLGHEADADHLRAGEGWALMDLARHSGQPDAGMALAASQGCFAAIRWPARLRPLGMLAALAERDAARGLGAIERQGAPRRMLRMLRHRLTGR